jgi:type VI secretion system protein ImpE
MTAEQLVRGGRLEDALAALTAQVRDDPANQNLRYFLVQLLCYAGEYDRAGKQLDVLEKSSTRAESLTVMLYRGCLAAERARLEKFVQEAGGRPAPAKAVSGSLNGKRFESLEDADPRIGARLEMFAAGGYLWVPLEHIAQVEIDPPQRLRDLLWSAARVTAGPGLKDLELGAIVLPVLAPLTFRHPEGAVRLGQMTVWERDESGAEAPYGQKMLLVDGEEIPLMEVRTLEIDQPAAAGED